MPLACRVHGTVIVSRSHRWHSCSQTKSKTRDEPNTATVIRCMEACLLTTRSKMFRQHQNVAWLHQDMQEQTPDFFVSFYSASCLSLGDLVQRCLGQPVDLLAPWPSAAVIPRRPSTAVHFQSAANAESRGTWKGWRTFAWMNWLSCGDTDFFFFNAYAEERTRS